LFRKKKKTRSEVDNSKKKNIPNMGDVAGLAKTKGCE
jgi:hypothetical protein